MTAVYSASQRAVNTDTRKGARHHGERRRPTMRPAPGQSVNGRRPWWQPLLGRPLAAALAARPPWAALRPPARPCALWQPSGAAARPTGRPWWPPLCSSSPLQPSAALCSPLPHGRRRPWPPPPTMGGRITEGDHDPPSVAARPPHGARHLSSGRHGSAALPWRRRSETPRAPMQPSLCMGALTEPPGRTAGRASNAHAHGMGALWCRRQCNPPALLLATISARTISAAALALSARRHGRRLEAVGT
jgi:hypothetical protein